MARRKQTSSSIAKERLKLVLIHDRAKTSPSSNMLQMLRKDIMSVISKYFDVDEDAFDVEIKNSMDIQSSDGSATKLTANIPIRNIKNIGRNRCL